MYLNNYQQSKGEIVDKKRKMVPGRAAVRGQKWRELKVKQGKLAIMISGEQLKTILFSLHHMLAPDEFLEDDDRDLLDMLETLHNEVFPSKPEINSEFAIDDLPF